MKALLAAAALVGCELCDGAFNQWITVQYLAWDEPSPAGPTPRALLDDVAAHLREGIPIRWASADGCWDHPLRRDLIIEVEPGEAIGPPVVWNNHWSASCGSDTLHSTVDLPVRVALRTADGGFATAPGGAWMSLGPSDEVAGLQPGSTQFRLGYAGLLTSIPTDTALAPGTDRVTLYLGGTVRSSGGTSFLVDVEATLNAPITGGEGCDAVCHAAAAGVDTRTACRGCCYGE